MEHKGTDTLKEKTAKGLFWGGMSNSLQQLLNLFFGIFLGRLLSPADYGMVGMLTVFSLIATSLQESGFTAAIANRKVVTHQDLNAVFWFNVAVSISLYIALFAVAPYIADFYHTPELTLLARYQFIGFVISSLGMAHYAVLFREMKVKQRTIASLSALCVSGVVGVTLAFLGFSYWGIATQNICYITVVNSFFWYFSGWRPTFSFTFQPIREMFGFSCKILATNVFNHINNNLFSVILGKSFNEQAVGYYNQGNKWNTMGNNLITGMMNSVAQPVLAQIHNEQDRQARVFRKLLRFCAFVSFPVMFGLSMISEELITILITNKWLESAHILSILSIGGAFLPITSLYTNLLISQGKSNLYLWNTVALSIFQLAALLLLYPWGINCMLYAYITLVIGWWFVWHFFARNTIGLGYLIAIREMLPFALIAALAMYISAYCCHGISHIYLRFFGKAMLACLIYIATMGILKIDVFIESIHFLKKKA